MIGLFYTIQVYESNFTLSQKWNHNIKFEIYFVEKLGFEILCGFHKHLLRSKISNDHTST